MLSDDFMKRKKSAVKSKDKAETQKKKLTALKSQKIQEAAKGADNQKKSDGQHVKPTRRPTGFFRTPAELPDPSVPWPNDQFLAKTRNMKNFGDASYWAAVCPDLTVGGQFRAGKPAWPADFVESFKEELHSEGVFQASPEDMGWSVDLRLLASNMVRLMQHGWPATFLIMYDEVWALIQRASRLMKHASGGNECNMDVLCWYVDPNRGDAGFSPHRDRQPDDSPATFRPGDGSPMYSTCWVPLTDACPENSCLYVVPRWADPGYFKGDDDDGPDPLSVALPSKEAFQAIRALPAAAGSAIMFSHRIIHWGSRGRKGYHTPRLAVSWGCADDAYEPPYFSRQHLPYPPMHLRAALACGQMLAYHERFPMSPRQLHLYYKVFKAHAGEFHQSYRDKVAAEFVAATRELVERGGGSGAAAAGEKKGEKAGEKAAAWAEARAAAAAEAAEAEAEARGGAAAAGKGKKRRAAAKGGGGGECATGGSDAAAGASAGAGAHATDGGERQGKQVKRAAATAKAAAGAADDGDGDVGDGDANGADVKPAKAGGGRSKAKAKAKDAELKVQAKVVAPKAKAQAKGAEMKVKAKEAEPKAKAKAAELDTAEDDDDDEEEEEGPGWEGLLGGSDGEGEGGGSEDEVLEDALDAMLDAQLTGRGPMLQDDYEEGVEGEDGENGDGGEGEEEEEEEED